MQPNGEPRPRGRPRTFPISVTFQVTPEQLDKMDDAALRAGMTRTEWLRHLIDEATAE